MLTSLYCLFIFDALVEFLFFVAKLTCDAKVLQHLQLLTLLKLHCFKSVCESVYIVSLVQDYTVVF